MAAFAKRIDWIAIVLRSAIGAAGVWVAIAAEIPLSPRDRLMDPSTSWARGRIVAELGGLSARAGRQRSASSEGVVFVAPSSRGWRRVDSALRTMGHWRQPASTDAYRRVVTVKAYRWTTRGLELQYTDAGEIRCARGWGSATAVTRQRRLLSIRVPFVTDGVWEAIGEGVDCAYLGGRLPAPPGV